MKIYKKDKNLIISIPLRQTSSNPYNDDEIVELDNIIGIITGDEYGFCNLIDMSYKGKGPQVGSWFVKFDEIHDNTIGDKETKYSWFTELCKKLDIDLFVYPICFKCKEIIYGSFTIDEKGNKICRNCDKE